MSVARIRIKHLDRVQVSSRLCSLGSHRFCLVEIFHSVKLFSTCNREKDELNLRHLLRISLGFIYSARHLDGSRCLFCGGFARLYQEMICTKVEGESLKVFVDDLKA